MSNPINLSRLKWITVVAISAFLLAIEYIRHVLFPDLLHIWPIYLMSIVVVGLGIWVFNELIFLSLQQSQRNLMLQVEENMRLQNELKEQANRLNTVIESSGNAVITMDLSGTIQSWNRAAEAIYGWPKRDAIGQRYIMVPADLQNDTRAMIQKLTAGETIHNHETIRLRNNGDRIPVLLTASPIRDAAGSVVSFMGISTDLRERKQLEQQLVQQQRTSAELQERDRLARELHDGLGQVLGFVNAQSQAVRELLLRGDTTSALSCLKELTDVAQDAHADVRDYILSLRADPTNQSFILRLQAYMQRFSRLSNIHTELELSGVTSNIAFAPDVESQLLRIVQEALTNARKHARAQNALVKIKRTDSGVVIELADDGAGFDLQAVAADDSRHFGIRIMQERAADCGCRVSIWSIPGSGTQVTIVVPESKLGQPHPLAEMEPQA